MRLISVIVGAENSKTRFNESATLLNYGFSNFESEKLVDNKNAIAKLTVLKGKQNSIDVYAKESFSAVVKKGDSSDYKIELNIAESVNAPTQEDMEVGEGKVVHYELKVNN